MVSKERKQELKEKENVIGVGEDRQGRIKVFVTQKVDMEELSDEDIVPQVIDGDDTDVVDSDVPRLLGVSTLAEGYGGDREDKFRPTPSGVSTAHTDVSAGTLGSPPLEVEGRDGLYFLTNSHVASPAGAKEGDEILQPGPADGGGQEDVIGILADFYEIDMEGTNTTDSALVKVDETKIQDNNILQVGGVTDWGDKDWGQLYVKSGRTTGRTEGTLVSTDTNIDINMGGGNTATFDGVDVFTPMSSGGDSGSLIGYVTEEGFKATHLLFAGSPFATIGIPIENVMEYHGELQIAEPPTEDEAETDKADRGVVDWLLDFIF